MWRIRSKATIENPHGELLPGAYAQVHLRREDPSAAMLVPASALLFRSEGPRLALVDASNKVTLAPVTLGRDFGTEIEIVGGVKPSDRVIESPPDAILNGDPHRGSETFGLPLGSLVTTGSRRAAGRLR